MRAILTVISVFALIMLNAQSASAQKRIALIIGNSDYKNISSLANPVNDAKLMEATLTSVGFKVVMATDANFNAMRRAIRDFGRELRAAGKDAVGLFYYAGHGVQSRGTNYLVPLGAEIADESDLSIEAVSTANVIAQMEGARNKLNLVILDSCRNNPFKGTVRSGGRGLARIDTASGTLVAFAAAPGQVADDGRGKNSPYTAALAEYIKKPNLSIEQVFKNVRNRVEEASNGKQTPWEESSLKGDFYFLGKSIEVTVQQNQPGENAFELSFWETIKDSESPRVFEEYLKAFPNGRFTGLAKVMMERLKKQETAAVSTAPVPKPAAPTFNTSLIHDCDRLAAHPADADRISTAVPFETLKSQISRAITACRNAVAAAPGTSRFEFQLGRALDAQKTYDQAVSWYQKAAARGYTAAMYNLAVSYDDGEGVAQDQAAANKWYRKAAANGRSSAMWNLSINLDEGKGGPHDPAGAANYLIKAYLAGHTKAQEAFGKNLNAWQVGTRREVQRILQNAGVYDGAVNGDVDSATQNAMQRYAAAKTGVKPTTVVSTKPNTTTTTQTGTNAQTGTSPQTGTTNQPAVAAIDPYASVHQCDRLAAHPSDGDRITSAVSFSTLQAQIPQTLAACRQAVNQYPGISRFEFQLGRVLDAQKSHSEAVRYYKMAANRRYTAAMYNLAVSYDDGEGIAKNQAQANYWYRLAADQGRSSAMWNLSINLDEGKGGARDPAGAAKYLLLAYRAGHNKAAKAFDKGLKAWQERTRREVQRILQRLGYYNGAIDGQIGSGTKTSARNYRDDG